MKAAHNTLFFIQPTLYLLLVFLTMQHLTTVYTFDTTNYQGNETDYTALLAIKSKLIDGSPNGVLSSWNNSLHHCFWEGVICGPRHNRVIKLQLPRKGLGGTISPFIGNLSFLRLIRFSNNSLQGRIPHEIGSLFRLEELYLANNSLSGEITANISSCVNLQILSVAINNLHGELPMELGALSNLNYLWAYNNKLSGMIPPSFSNLSSLLEFSLSNNQLHGKLPMELGALSSLRFLFVGFNSFTGMIPSTIFNLSSLQTMELCNNQLHGRLPPLIAFALPQLQFLLLFNNHLSGPLPTSLSNLTSLQSIELNNNKFTGSISDFHFGHLHNLQLLSIFDNSLEGDISFIISTLINCTKLNVLQLGSNHFTGLLPKVIANLSTTLTKLSIYENMLDGEFPMDISNLINLTIINMDKTGLTGTIPQDLGKLQQLEQLYFSHNKLTGEIPFSIGNLSRLSTLNLRYNNMQGKIPPSLGDCKGLLFLYLSANNFNGPMPKNLFGGSANFIELNLAYNQLEGLIPVEINKQINMIEFSVFGNKLNGEIPDVFSGLPDLEILWMGDNKLHGSIPSTFASLKSLLIVDLSKNNLSGIIPEYLSTFPMTYLLNLSYNNFEGSVPTKGVFSNASAIFLDGNIRLCGGILKLHLPRCVENKGKKRRMSHALKLTFMIICAFVGVLFIATCIWLYLKRLSEKGNSTSIEALRKESFLKVSYDMLLKATDGFSTRNLLGSGTFGSVFKGMLDGKTVAIKVLNLQQIGGYKSFMAECEALKNIRHRNLVGILTACSSMDFQRNDFKALVYEFMPNGSVESWLHGNGKLSLLQRLNIAIDVAHALLYIHCECSSPIVPIVHCDLKPSNILLSDDMVARVADFGLAKVLDPQMHPNQSSSIGARGTIGYIAPEYGLGNEASLEADLYSYGIVLLELMTRKRPTNDMFKEDFNLHMYAKAALPNQVLQIVDSKLLEDNESEGEADEVRPMTRVKLKEREECMMHVVKIGVACSSQLSQDRMKIREAISELYFARNILCKPQNKHYLPRGVSD